MVESTGTIYFHQIISNLNVLITTVVIDSLYFDVNSICVDVASFDLKLGYSKVEINHHHYLCPLFESLVMEILCVHVFFPRATSQYTLPELWGGEVPTSGSGYS